MWICEECGHVMEEPHQWIEDGQRYTGCPRCYGTCAPAFECKYCGEIMPSNEAKAHLSACGATNLVQPEGRETDR